ncbi:hypothetical protein ACFXKD_00635 [Nocardiopsis aegyptia]|uniref:vWA-MoxR associated conflict system protein n=1 Tax=Nocardiopsis aegyptia TaxID=220378 RepID=UPI00366F1A29
MSEPTPLGDHVDLSNGTFHDKVTGKEETTVQTVQVNIAPESSSAADSSGPVPRKNLQLSPVGRDALAAALRDSTQTIPQLSSFLERSEWSRSDLGQLIEVLNGVTECLETECLVRDHLLCLVQGLDLAVDAREFVTTCMPQAATARALRRALLASTNDLPQAAPKGLSEHLETAVLRRPANDTHGRTTLMDLVLRLALEADVDTHDQAFGAWCQNSGYDVGELNSLRHQLTSQDRAERCRLLVHLRGDPDHDWPCEGTAWVFKGGNQEPLAEYPSLRCEPSTDGVAILVDEVLEWAHDLPDVTLLERVHIAVPARTLLCWRAEETDVGVMLGADHEVVVHWGGRLRPSKHLRSLVRHALYRLKRIEQHHQVYGAVDWVSLEESEFMENIKKGTYRGPLGLRCTPIGQEDLFEALLAQFPIMLWPEQTVPEGDEVEQAVEHEWVTLPGGFTGAYRTAWTCAQEQVPPLARLRAVWDDRHWLTFCRTLSKHRAGIASPSGA